MADSILHTLGRYTIRAELGKGGFATVYRATDTALERDVALKVLKPGWTDDAKAVERFMREARQALRLEHLNFQEHSQLLYQPVGRNHIGQSGIRFSQSAQVYSSTEV